MTSKKLNFNINSTRKLWQSIVFPLFIINILNSGVLQAEEFYINSYSVDNLFLKDDNTNISPISLLNFKNTNVKNPFKLSVKHGRRLVWPIPVDYFKKWDGLDYYNEVEEGFWPEVAEKFKEYSIYFSSIVEEGNEWEIIDYLNGLFNSPWDEELLSDFESEVNEYIKPWFEIDSKIFSGMNLLLQQEWEKLKLENEALTLVLANQDEIIKRMESKLQKLISDRENIEWEWKNLLSELAEFKSELAEEKSELAEEKSELAEEKSELAEEKSELAEEKSELAEEKSELAEEKSELAEEKSELAEEKSELAEFKSELVEEKSELVEEKSELAEFKSELAEFKSELVEEKSELVEEKSELAEFKSELVELDKEIAEKIKNIKMLDRAIAAVKEDIKILDDM